MDLPREYISYSQIRLYQTCPKKYYYTYIREIRTPINDKIFLGVVFHATVEHYLNEKINGNKLNQETIDLFFKEEFEKTLKSSHVTWAITPEETQKRGLAFVRHFVRTIACELDPLMVEKELVAELPELGVKLKGIIDLVETDFSITDFKTTTAKWAKSRIQSSYLQMQIYRFLFEQSFGDVVKMLRFRVIYAKDARKIKDQCVSVNANDLDSAKMFDIIKYVVDGIRGEVFYKNESYVCGFCEYKDLCRTENPEPL